MKLSSGVKEEIAKVSLGWIGLWIILEWMDGAFTWMPP
jgi:hypothetical protein